MIYKCLIFTILSIAIFSCKPTTQTTTAAESATTAQTPLPSTAIKGQPVPPMGKDYFDKLYKNVDAIDYIFYDLPFSMSQTELTAVQSNVGFISTGGPGGIPASCGKALGRKFFKNNGEMLAEAEMYFSDGCRFYVFMDGNKKVYANNMTQQGINFYNNIINQIQAPSK